MSPSESVRPPRGPIPDPAPAAPGFAHINRYWDPKRHAISAKVQPGEYYVTQQDEFIITTLGSCVAACVWDPVASVGGMNHFMLASPGGGPEEQGIGASTRYGVFAMEFLVNGVLALGGKRERLCVKIAGGGAVLGQMMTNIGAANIAFVRSYIQTERLKLMGEHVGGLLPRKLCFHATSGSAQVKSLARLKNDTIVTRERKYAQDLQTTQPTGAVELFKRDGEPPKPR